MEEKFYTSSKSIQLATEDKPFKTESNQYLKHIDVEYETYGELNSTKSNAILILHALTGDAHVCGWDKNWKSTNRTWRKDKPGWWDNVVGPNRLGIDTNKFFVICSNVLGGCYGTTGPSSINQETNSPYSLDFPVVTVGDWVKLQKLLVDSFGIKKLYAVVGGSLGGQQALEWMLAYPEYVEKGAILASAHKLSTQGLAFNAVGRHCIMNDVNFANGNYYNKDIPEKGLAAARMLAHITYLSEKGMSEKFGRKLQNSVEPNYKFGIEYQVESYLNHQGKSFINRFDANSYLYITKAMDYYDAAARWGKGDLQKALERINSEVFVMTFSSDWLYTPKQSLEMVKALAYLGKKVNYVEIESTKGHDAFLIETEEVSKFLNAFLEEK